MPKYLHITEYSSSIPYKIPKKKSNEHDLEFNGNIIRTSVDTNKERIKENFDYLFDESKILEDTIPLKDIIIYDNKDIENEDQKLAYVYECPICLEKTITTDSKFNYCPHCENDKFLPQVIGLIHPDQMDEIAIDNSDISYYIQVEDGNIVIRKEPKEKESNA